MRSEHRAPLIASIVVVLACACVLGHAIRSDALGGFARLAPLRVLAGEVISPRPVVAEPPAVVAVAAVAPSHTGRPPHQHPHAATSPAQPRHHATVAPVVAGSPAPAVPAVPVATPDVTVPTPSDGPRHGHGHGHGHHGHHSHGHDVANVVTTVVAQVGQTVDQTVGAVLRHGRDDHADNGQGHGNGNDHGRGNGNDHGQGSGQGHGEGHGRGHGRG